MMEVHVMIKGTKSFPQTAEQEITDRLEMKKKKKI